MVRNRHFVTHCVIGHTTRHRDEAACVCPVCFPQFRRVVYQQAVYKSMLHRQRKKLHRMNILLLQRRLQKAEADTRRRSGWGGPDWATQSELVSQHLLALKGLKQVPLADLKAAVQALQRMAERTLMSSQFADALHYQVRTGEGHAMTASTAAVVCLSLTLLPQLASRPSLCLCYHPTALAPVDPLTAPVWVFR